MAVAQISTSIRVMSRVERWLRRHVLVIWLLVGAYLVLYALYDYFLLHSTSHFIDWFSISTVAVFSVGAYLATEIPAHMARTYARLVNRGALDVSPDWVDVVRQQLERFGARAARVGGGIGTLVAIATLALANYYTRFYSQLLGDSLRHLSHDFAAGGARILNALEDALYTFGLFAYLPLLVFIGYFVGYYIGYMIANGRFARFLKKRHVMVRVRPGHPDGAAGLSVIGTLYLFQAGLVAIPVLFFAAWQLLMRNVPTFHSAYYGVWYTPNTYLIPVFLLAEIVAFVAPMWLVHREMAAQKQVLLHDSDTLSQRITALQDRVVEAQTPDEVRGFSDQIETMTTYYRAVQHMPTWPVDGGTLRRFALGNLSLVLSVAAQPILDQIGSWLGIH